MVEELGLWSQNVWVQILALLLPGYETFGKLFNHSVPQFPHLQHGLVTESTS